MSNSVWMSRTVEVEELPKETSPQCTCMVADAEESETPELSPFASKMIWLTLVLGVVWLAGMAAWVWGGLLRYQDFSRLFPGS